MAKKSLITNAAPRGSKSVKYYTEEQVLAMRDWEEDEVYAIKLYFNSVRLNEQTGCPTIGFTSKANLKEQLKDIIVQYYVYELMRGSRNHLQFVWHCDKDFDALYEAFCNLWSPIEYSS